MRINYQTICRTLIVAFIFYTTPVIAQTNSNISSVAHDSQNNVYISLSAIQKNKQVRIKWISESRGKNIQHYALERSDDNLTFKTVAIILDGFEAGESTKQYEVKEAAPDKDKIVYYRIKEVRSPELIRYSPVFSLTSEDIVSHTK